MAEKSEECFIVGVIGKEGTEQRIHADWFIDGIVTPVFDAHFSNFRVIRADRMNTPGIITSQIIDKLLNAKLVIADMTFLNANAFYEIGIRHMTALPIIHTHRDGDAIPFDVSTFLSMGYSTIQHSQVKAAQGALKVLVENVLAEGHVVENPVTQARGKATFEETATAPDKLLLTQIEGLSTRLAKLEINNLRNMPKHVSHALFTSPITNEPETHLLFSIPDDAPKSIMERFRIDELMQDLPATVVVGKYNNGRQLSVRFDRSNVPYSKVEDWIESAAKFGIDATFI